jgi:DNA-binding CsgD family transcriptional regulator
MRSLAPGRQIRQQETSDELVTREIAGQLYISVSTVRSHLDRVRDKTGYRRRADLTRLALSAGLVQP